MSKQADGLTAIAGRKGKKNYLGSVAAAALVIVPLNLWATAAYAEDAGANAQDATNADATKANVKEGEIVVTAQKRSERQVDVPASITIVTPQILARSNIQDVRDLVAVVPGFRVDTAGTLAQPIIRSVGATSAGAGLAASVATYIDGFYRPSQTAGNGDLFDIQSIEVLKGPQGSLYGRNATAGALLITTRMPSFTPEAEVKLSYGNFRDIKANVYLSGKLTDNLAASLTFYSRNSQGYNYNIFTHKHGGPIDVKSGRFKLLWQPSNKIKFLLTLEKSYTSDPQPLDWGMYPGSSAFQNVPDAHVTYKPNRISEDFPVANIQKHTGVFLKGMFDLGKVNVTTYTSWEKTLDNIRLDSDATALSVLNVYTPFNETTYLQEVDVNYRTSRLNLVAGAFYEHDNSYQAIFLGGDATTGSPDPNVFAFGGNVISKSYAFFADGTYNLFDHLFLTAGIRYNHDALSEGVHFALHGPNLVNGHVSFNSLTPRAVLRYEINPHASIYASYSQGFKAGGFNLLGASNVPVKPEKIEAYEAGFKYARGGIRFELAGYYYKYKDLQFQTAHGNIVILLNAATADIKGMEAHFAGKLNNHFQVDLGGNWTPTAKYSSFKNAPDYEIVTDPMSGEPSVVVSGQDASGHRMTRSPKLSMDASLTYSQQLLQGELALTGSYSYQSTLFYDPFYVSKQKSYGLLNFRGSWTAPNGKWTVAAYGKNVLNKHFYYTVSPAALNFTRVDGPPAQYGIELSFKY